MSAMKDVVMHRGNQSLEYQPKKNNGKLIHFTVLVKHSKAITNHPYDDGLDHLVINLGHQILFLGGAFGANLPGENTGHIQCLSTDLLFGQ